MTNNNSIQVFEGGWKELETAVITDNEAPLSSSTPLSFFIKPDGTLIFVLSETGMIIETYPLSTPYDITTIGAIGNTFAMTDDLFPIGIFFRDNGSLMIVVGNSTETLYAYTLPIPWDVSSIVDSPATLDVSDIGTFPVQCTFSRDGDFVFVTDFISVHSFALPTPWDITSANPLGSTEFTPAGSIDADSIAFKREGDRMYIGDINDNIIVEYTLSPVNDITSAVLVSTLDLGTLRPDDINFRSNGQEFFVMDNVADNITKFHTDEDWKTVDASHFTNNFGLTANLANRDITWKPDGTQFITLGNGPQDMIESYTPVERWNISGATMIAAFNTSGIGETTPVSMSWTKDGKTCYLVGQSELVRELDVGTAWDILTITASGNTFDASVTNPVGGLYVTDDGTKFYMSGGTTNRNIFEFDMSTPFDISTGLINQTVSFGAGGAGRGVFLKPDGKILYLVNDPDNTIDMFELTTPFDISTNVFITAFDVTAQDTSPHGIFIREDNGRKLYLTGIVTDTLYSFDLTSEFTTALITTLGDELVTDLGEILVYT